MEFEFDKEMDALLRQAARNKEVVPANFGAHLDADEISLFAENALPVKARQRVTQHFADCRRCRKILSEVISLNAESESEIVHARGVTAAMPVSIPWYKKLFAFPQMAYAMGALALVFSGIIAFAILQNARESPNSSVAQIEQIQERTNGASGPNLDEETASSEIYSMSNSSTSNMSATAVAPQGSAMSSNMSANSSLKPNATVSAPNPSSPALREEKQAEAAKESGSALTTVAPQSAPAQLTKRENFDVAAGTPPPPAPKKDNNYRVDEDAPRSVSKQENEITQNSSVQNQINIMPDSRNARQLPLNNRSVARQSVETTTADSSASEKRKSADTRTAGGRVFKLSRGAWYDSDYSQQETISVRRNSKEYKKLDAGLRSIAENIGGVVIVVWKGKAYRIQ